jgi:hypothetical protein
MQQDMINQTNNRLTFSFQQKSTALSLLVVLGGALYYVTNMWPMRPIALANDSIPAGYGSLLLSTVMLITVSQIVLQIALAIATGNASTTPHDKVATLKANRNAYFVLVAGVFAAVGSVFLEELTPFCTANLATMGFLAAEIVKLISQLYYSRR